jgi:ATP-dependent RNA helicase DeaD
MTTPEIDSIGPEPIEETTAEASPSPVSRIEFDELGLSDELRRGIAEHGYTHATPVQARAIPLALEGTDLIVRSKTGTGKTAAFGIPLLERIPAGTRAPMALVLCPTRELALQVAEELTALGQHKDVQVAAIYGGTSMRQQFDALKQGAEIIVGTPGRVYDHIRRGTLDLSSALFAVLDEADEMLSQGFYEEVTRILEHLPTSRQTLLFSATVSDDIERLIQRFCRDPETILLSGDDYTVEGIENVRYFTVDDYPKPRNLIYLVEIERPTSAIVFCNTRDDTSLVNAVLTRNGFDSEILNGDLPQKQRERVMAKVKRGDLNFLVATDIAARGIDISDLSHVINYSLPEDPAVYLHRVGRTGRIGKKGVAISLVSGRELSTLSALEKRFDIHFTERKLPTVEQASALWAERHIGALREVARSSIYESMLPLVEALKSAKDGDMLIAAMLKNFFDQRRIEKARAAALAESQPEVEVKPSIAAKKKSGRDKAPLRGACFEERPPKADADEAEARSDEVRLWTNIGEGDVKDETTFREILIANSGIAPDELVRIELGKDYGALFVKPGVEEKLLEASGFCLGTDPTDKDVTIERPRKKRAARRSRR